MLGIDASPWITVPVPRSPHIAAGFDDLYREALATKVVELVYTAETRADDEDVKVFRRHCGIARHGGRLQKELASQCRISGVEDNNWYPRRIAWELRKLSPSGMEYFLLIRAAP